jgi:hypothetical protein
MKGTPPRQTRASPHSDKDSLDGTEPYLRGGVTPPDKRGHRTSHSRTTNLTEPPPKRNSPDSRMVGNTFFAVPVPVPHQPALDFTLRREPFGVASGATTIDEKFHLLAKPRSVFSSLKLTTKRCFSMHQVRGCIARGMQNQQRRRELDSSFRPVPFDSRSSSASSSPEPDLVPRAQWMKEAEPNLSGEEADSLWRVSNTRLFGEGQHLYSHPNVSSFTGGNTLKVTAQIYHSARGPRHVKIALDTQSCQNSISVPNPYRLLNYSSCSHH